MSKKKQLTSIDFFFCNTGASKFTVNNAFLKINESMVAFVEASKEIKLKENLRVSNFKRLHKINFDIFSFSFELK